MKLVSYTRASTERQVEIGMGLEVQAAAIDSWSKRAGHNVVARCSDEGLSGTMHLDDREGLTEALSLVRMKKAHGIVVSNLDRLARKLTVQEAVLADIWEAEGRVFSVDEDGEILEDDPDDPMRTAIRQMRGVFAELDRKLIVKRLRDGRKKKAELGGYASGAPRMGFKADQRQLVPIESEQTTICRIAELRAAGASLPRNYGGTAPRRPHAETIGSLAPSDARPHLQAHRGIAARRDDAAAETGAKCVASPVNEGPRHRFNRGHRLP